MKVKLIGYKAKVRYRYARHRYLWGYDKVEKYLDDYEEVIIWEGNLELKTPEKGDSIYVEDIEKIFEISNVALNSGGGVVCWTKTVVEKIVDEATETTRETALAEERREELERLQEETELRIKEQCGQEGEWVTPKKWYQFWK